MIYYSRNYIIHTHYAYIVRADVIECADAPDYTCILLHVQQKFSFCRLKKHKNLKPQPERKTLRQKRRVALVGGNCQYQISNLFAWRCHPKLCGLDCCWCDRILGPQGWLALFLRNLTIFHKIVFQYQWVHDQETIGKTKSMWSACLYGPGRLSVFLRNPHMLSARLRSPSSHIMVDGSRLRVLHAIVVKTLKTLKLIVRDYNNSHVRSWWKTAN